MKIAAVIVLILAIIGASIAYTFMGLNQIGLSTDKLEHQSMNTISIANNVERQVHEIRLVVRRFGILGSAEDYKDASARFDALIKYLDESIAVAGNEKMLAELKTKLEAIKVDVVAYKGLLENTNDSFVAIQGQTKIMASDGEVILSEISKYYSNQYSKMQEEVLAGDNSKIKDRVWKVETMDKANQAIFAIRLGTQKSIEAKTAVAFDTPLAKFGDFENNVKAILAKSVQQSNIDQLNKVLNAAKNYQGGIKNLQTEYGELDGYAKQRSAIGDKIIKTTSELAKASVDDTIVMASTTNSKVATSTNTIVISFVIALVVGIAASYVVIRKISNAVKEITVISRRISEGEVDLTVAVTSEDEIGQLGNAFNTMIDNIKRQTEIVTQIADGERNIVVEVRSEKDLLNQKLQQAVTNLGILMNETSSLTESVKSGNLKKRGDTTILTGVWSDLIAGVNNLIEAFVKPIDVTNAYVTNISKGIIPEKISEVYYGDFNTIKESLNQCIDSVNLLVSDTNVLIDAAIAGKLDTRADESRHNGDFKAIVQGVNRTLDAVIEPVKEAAAVLDEMAKGNLSIQVKGNYQGDHAAIKDALNNTIFSVKGYISDIASVLDKMAQGDLNVEITADFKGDFIELKNSINNIIYALNEVLGEINVAAEQVSQGSKQVAQSSQALSQGATEQASAIEEITATVTEIAEQTRGNAQNANKAKDLSTHAMDDAVVGNSQMKDMVFAMKDINESSANISKIISVIDEIAFQTNILALNAAVEAARAGQYGKGFAVVAEEVRNLAARSANAAKETTVLIENSIQKVNAGTEIANETAVALDKIVTGVSETAAIVGDIASASIEQATAITQVNEGVYQISQVTQSNTATAEESAAASEEMTSQAQLLREMVERFKLKHTMGRSARMHEKSSTRGSRTTKAHHSDSYDDDIHISLDDREFGKY